MGVMRSLARMSVLALVLVLMSMSVRACHTLPALKRHPAYALFTHHRAPAIVLE